MRLKWLVLLLVLVSCSTAQTPPTPSVVLPHGRITFAGSTTVQPLVDKLGVVFRQSYPNIELDIAAGGSLVGITAIHQGSVDIGMSSRALHTDESANITEHHIANDVLAVVVHPQNPVANLTRQQLTAIYTGKITNWRELGGNAAPITVILREETSGTRGAFDEIALNKQVPSAPNLQTAVTAGDVVAQVAADPLAIGYIGFGNLDASVKTLSIDGVLPDVASVQSKRYTLVRPLLLLTGPLSQPITKQFIDFVLSDAGQKLVAADGWIPVR